MSLENPSLEKGPESEQLREIKDAFNFDDLFFTLRARELRTKEKIKGSSGTEYGAEEIIEEIIKIKDVIDRIIRDEADRWNEVPFLVRKAVRSRINDRYFNNITRSGGLRDKVIELSKQYVEEKDFHFLP